MEFGIVVQCNPPASRTIELAVAAENRGFDYFWTFDSHLLWQEPYVIYSQILANTRNIKVGPMVTNPLTRDWTVTASTYATLNSMYGNRTVCGIGRGDSAVRSLAGKPSTLTDLRNAVGVVGNLANGRTSEVNGSTVRLPWAAKSQLDVYVAAYGPKALELTGQVADGFLLQLADPAIAKWTIERVKNAAADAGRDPDDVKICVAAPAYVGDDIEHQRDQCRWFGAMVGNHVADIVSKYGTDESGRTAGVPKELTDYIKGRQGYDYNEHGRAGNSHASFVPDEIVDRFCILGGVDNHVERLKELQKLGADQFAIYLQHDGQDQTIAEYGNRVIGAINAAESAIL
ncbi:TIGR03842 family LLM class F420-dependent oxidoreductase [Rhodococcus sp. B10]|uniref:TIGR03842 family LLM class F420-dependent oxidoreductase n=1 Tax=Rhodococcus sp. B10 TaxID=2695876 RepID=UPI0014314221|nr:TIGR03842 family LLM class F420-dependent oxidoreductase [Rhodococcus sp. B10]NIL78368.1 putative coenzyme oxidoreductase [Rhodococcus sp. B10]